jgi:UDP-N-acetylmuramoylalanine--D-glutamate ligase
MIFKPEIRDKKITVLGAARSGIAVAELLAKEGARVLVSERSDEAGKMAQTKHLSDLGIQVELGAHSSRIYDSDYWVVSPGIPQTSPDIQKAVKLNIPVYGELEVASWFCRAPIIAVTGSNGKSTVTALLGEIFKQVEIPCVVAGNIGQSFSGTVQETVPEGVAVLEVSSFQLETIHHFRPKISIMLNLTPDHLDRHGSMEVYGDIKSRIFENQTAEDWFVYNGCDKEVVRLAAKANCQRAVFGSKDMEDVSGFDQDHMLTIRMLEKDENILPVQEMGIQGEHNVFNALAASVAARFMNVSCENIASTLRNFKGLPHRMEFVREFQGVRWINDSKATNVDSVWYALDSFTAPIILIAGGRDKDSDFSRLKDRVRCKVRSIILIGEAADKMEQIFRDVRPVQRATTLLHAVDLANQTAKKGDVVLLSPACASFDQFHDFEERGNRFKELVRKL